MCVALTLYTYGLVSYCGRHIFGSQTFFKSRIRPKAFHPMLAFDPSPVEGKFLGISLFSKDCGRPRDDQGASWGSTYYGVDLFSGYYVN